MNINNNHSNTKEDFLDDEISLKEVVFKLHSWFYYVSTKWKFVLIAGILGGLLGFLYASRKQPIFTAELTFALENASSGGGLGGALGLAGQFGIDLGGTAGGIFEGDNLQELMKSRYMVESTLITPIEVQGKRTTLADLYIDFNDFRGNWKHDSSLQKLTFAQYRIGQSRLRDSILRVLYKKILSTNLVVSKKDKKLSIISVNVSSSNETFSKFFSEMLTENVSEFYIQSKTNRSAYSVNILQRQTDSVRRALNTAIAGVATNIDANPNANPALQLLKVPSKRREVDVQANQVILTELVKNLEISKMSLRKETPLIQIIDRPNFPLEVKKVGKLRSVVLGSLLMSMIYIIAIVLIKFYRQIINA